MVFIFLLFLFPDFVKAEKISDNVFFEINKLEELNKKELSNNYFLKEIPRTKVSTKKKPL